jgi:multicomponent K+:H+ antiporter subunit E
MSRIVPHPLLTGALILMWLLLNRFSLGHLLLGTAIALVAGRAMAALEPARPRLRRPGLMLRLAGAVSLDILQSNLAVARQIVTGHRDGRPGLVEVDLELRDPTALAALAVIVTSTPGTAWFDYDAARGRLLLHVIDLVDEDEWRDTINRRYGRLLKEIFE